MTGCARGASIATGLHIPEEGFAERDGLIAVLDELVEILGKRDTNGVEWWRADGGTFGLDGDVGDEHSVMVPGLLHGAEFEGGLGRGGGEFKFGELPFHGGDGPGGGSFEGELFGGSADADGGLFAEGIIPPVSGVVEANAVAGTGFGIEFLREGAGFPAGHVERFSGEGWVLIEFSAAVEEFDGA